MSETVLAIEGVTRRFGGLLAVNEVSFQVGRNEVVAVIGPNGAGKTTLFNLLTGQLKPTKGEVRFCGRAITQLAPHQRARLGMSRTFQITRPLASMSALENVMIGAFLHNRRLASAQSLALQFLDEVGLADCAGRSAGDLSLGEQRRLEVARALALQPQIILLDEVMAGLNQSEVAVTIEMFRRLHRGGLTLLVIEHNLKVVRALSERVVVLDHGVLIAEGGAEDILNAPAVVEAYLGRRRH
jgi:branched-chain amino acid transport system ATP-binding protein